MAFSKQRPNMVLEEDKDEDISIDFSKIKNIFKKKGKKEKVEKQKKEVKDAEKEIKEEIEEKEVNDIITKEEDAKKVKEVSEMLRIFEHAQKPSTKISDKIKIEEKKIEDIEQREKKIKKDLKKAKEEIKEEDEISLDFGKLRNIFKRKEKPKEEIQKEIQKKEKDDDDISLDFSKIKSFFKKKKESKEEDKEETISTSDLSNFYNKYKYIIIPLVIILFAMSLSIYLRIQPAYLPQTDDWATNSVYNYFRSQIVEQINQQYPNLPEANKNVLIDTEFQKILEQQKPQIEQQIKQTSAFFKSHLQNDKGQTYLLAIDPYFWMRKAENIVEHGYPGDIIKEVDGKKVQWNDHMLAPKGREITPDEFHPYFEAYLYKFLRIFNKDLELMKVAFYIPVIISALSVIPAFFIARKFGGNFAGFVAAVFIATHTSFLNRTVGGFSDTDAYNVFFPLFVLWLYIESLGSKNTTKSIAFTASSGLLVGLYSFAWGGWWYIVDFIIAASIIYLAYYFLSDIKEIKKGFVKFVKRAEVRNILLTLLVFLISSAVFVTLFRSYSTLEEAWRSPLYFTQIKEVGISKIWPNVFTTVAEQNEASLSTIISNIGGKFLFFVSLIGILLIMMGKGSKNKRNMWFITISILWVYFILNIVADDLNLFFILLIVPIIAGLVLLIMEGSKKADVKIAVLLIIWYLSTIYASTKGVRWVLLLVPAFSIAFGIALGKIYQYLGSIAVKELNINKVIARIVIIVLLCLLLVGPWNSAKSIAKQEIPSMNDAWWNSLEKIKLESEPNAIINSWWDFGHWFKTIADRAVTFDGTSQNSPQAHWIGKVLLTNDEDTAVGILRMLDCGANDAFDELNKIINDTAHSIEIIYDIVPKNKDGAKKILLGHNISKEQTDLILTKTHCDPPEDYFIASEDMVGKSGVWAHFGSWDFNRAQIYNTLNKKGYKNNKEASLKYLKERFGYNDDEANNMYYEVTSLMSSSDVNNWIAPWPSYGGSDSCNKQDEFNLVCAGIQVDLKNNEMFAVDQNQEKRYPRSFVMPSKDGSLVTKEYNESVLTLQNGRPLGAVLIPEGNSYNILLMDYALTGSMFTRMFYMDGHSLQHFKEFNDERSIFGGRIIVYKVDWDGGETNIMDHFKQLEEEKLRAEEERKKAVNESINISINSNESQ